MGRDRFDPYEAGTDFAVDTVDPGEAISQGQLVMQGAMIDGVPIRVGVVNWQSLIVFPRKTIIGDATNDSDDYFTTLILDNLAGGHGLVDMNETTDINRYNFGDLVTRRPRAVHKPPLVEKVEELDPEHIASASDRRWIGQLYIPGSGYYVDVFMIGLDVYYGTGDGVATFVGSTTAEPTGDGIEYQGLDSLNRLVWPTGNGYARLSTAFGFTNTLASPGLVPAAVAMAVWDSKLLAVDTAGQLWYSVNISSGWAEYTGAKIPSPQIIRNLLIANDRGGVRVPYIVTNRTIWQFIAEGTALIEIVEFSFPTHRHSGKGSCVWNGDIYVGSGMNVMRYNGGAKQFVGLDRDDGLPREYRGYITDLKASDRGVFAFVTPLDVDDGYTGTRYTSVHEMSTNGWSMVWAAQSDSGVNQFGQGISQSGPNDRYRLYWGHYFDLYYIDFPLDPFNPKQMPLLSKYRPGRFELTTAWFDAQLKAYLKLGNGLDVWLEDMSPQSIFELWYQIDSPKNTWLLAGKTSRNDLTNFPLRQVLGHEAEGEIFQQIRFKWVLEDWSYNSPYIVYVAFSCMKIGYPAWNWSFVVDMATKEGVLHPDIVDRELSRIFESGQFVEFSFRDKLYRAKISQYYGAASPTTQGKQDEIQANLSIIGLPESTAKSWFQQTIR